METLAARQQRRARPGRFGWVLAPGGLLCERPRTAAGPRGSQGLDWAAGGGRFFVLLSHLSELTSRTPGSRRHRARGGDPADRAAGGAHCKCRNWPQTLRSWTAPAPSGAAAGLVDIF